MIDDDRDRYEELPMRVINDEAGYIDPNEGEEDTEVGIYSYAEPTGVYLGPDNMNQVHNSIYSHI